MKQKLSQWARENRYSYQGAYLAFKAGKIPGAYQSETGKIIVDLKEAVKQKILTITYARVSSTDQKSTLKPQSLRLQDFCIANGWIISKNYEEIASGLNDSRRILDKILEIEEPIRLVVEHKDRLTRFGFNYIKRFIESKGGEIILINEVDNHENEILEDFVSIITSFCSRIYGSRRSKRKTEKMIKELESDG